jgi:hypothetical protein
MRFISKNANLRVVLKPGMPAEPMTGRAATPGLYARFEDGVLESNNAEFLEILMTTEKGYGSDFILADNVLPDPFIRTSSEPEHDIMEIKYGHVEKCLNPRPQITITPEMKKAIENMAVSMAKEMAPKMAMELLHNLKEQTEKNVGEKSAKISEPTQSTIYEGIGQTEERKEETKTKKEVAHKGRPPKAKIEQPLVDEDGPVPHVEI